MALMDLSEVIDELYRLPPTEFTARRAHLTSQARGEGNRSLAESISKLRKPTSGAWLANLLVRERRDEVEAALGLGQALREAQAKLAGDELRGLAKQRHDHIDTLCRLAHQLAEGHAHKTAESSIAELQRTLEAATADEDMARALRSGMLTAALHYTGLGLPMTAPSEGASPTTARPTPGTRRRHGGATNVVALRQAEHAAAEATRKVKTLAQGLAKAERDLHELRGRIAGAERELANLQRAEREATKRAAEARNAIQVATAAERTATRTLARLRRAEE
jgi:hypothetical protein